MSEVGQRLALRRRLTPPVHAKLKPFRIALLAISAFALAVETPESLYHTAFENFSQQRFEASERLLREVIKRRPRWFEARFLLGASLVSLGRSGEAVEQLEVARSLNPGHLDCVKLLVAEYLGLSRPADVLRLVRPLLVGSRADEELLLLAIEALQVRNDAGDADEALRLCTRGLARFPRSPRLLAWRGFALREQGALPEARRSLDAALALSPNDLVSRGLLADVMRREGHHKDALRLFDQVLSQAPFDEEAVLGKSRTLAAMDDVRGALEVVRTAAAAAPQVARFRLELSQLYAKLGESDNASREAAEFRRLRGSQAERPVPAGLRTPAK